MDTKFGGDATDRAAKKVWLSLVEAWPVIRSRAFSAHGSSSDCEWPPCYETSMEIGLWLEDHFDHPVEPVQGYFDGVEDWYHWWVEVKIGRKTWIIDGSRRQFVQGPELVMLPKRSSRGSEYQTSPNDD